MIFHFLFTVSTLFLLNACSTTKLIKYEQGELLQSQENIQRTDLPTEIKFKIENTSKDQQTFSISINEDSPYKEEWDDIYEKLGVYEMRYSKETITTTNIEKGYIIQKDSKVISNLKSITPSSIKLTINSIEKTATISDDDKYYFSFKDFKLNPLDSVKSNNVSIRFDKSTYDVGYDYSLFLYRYQENIKRRKIAQEEEKKLPENKYAKKFCREKHLFEELYHPQQVYIEKDCLYVLAGPLQVLQSVRGGVLINLPFIDNYFQDRTIFIKTKRNYVDGDRLPPIFVHSIKNFNYNTVLRANKTVYAFEELGDADLSYMSGSGDL